MSSLIDFHCHLDLYPDFEKLVLECERQKTYTLAVTTTPRAWPRNQDVCCRTKYVRPALGLHPQLVEDCWREIDLWERHLPETRYVGEVGLDAGPQHYRSFDRQKDVFARVLKACAAGGGKVLSVHSVRAATVVLDMIEQHLPAQRATVIMHWFSGSIAEAKRAVDLGCYFSINEQMFRTPSGAKLARTVPFERVLTETDGPFTKVGDRPSRPSDVGLAVKAVAYAVGRSEDDTTAQVALNLKQLLDPQTWLPS